ncbi:MAG TPA: hypothetical protein PK342_11900 [Methylotenera sp.]|nr:hypothetical protein [Methylotenera sp.]
MKAGQSINAGFNPADRTYQVSDERLRAFRALTPAQRLEWVEELAHFLRLAKAQNLTKPKN